MYPQARISGNTAVYLGYIHVYQQLYNSLIDAKPTSSIPRSNLITRCSVTLTTRHLSLHIVLQISGMDQLWGIALRAQNTDVSLNAIQYLNNHYINCKFLKLIGVVVFFMS